LKTLLVFLSFFLLSGCGYTTKSLLPPDVKTVFVKTFKNEIDLTKEVTDRSPYQVYRPGTEQLITDEIINRFIYDGTLRIATENKADLILEGALVDYIRQALRYDEAENVTEYRVNVVVRFKVKNLHSGEEMLSVDRMVSDASYLTGGKFARSEQAALIEAAQDMARRVVEKVVESGW
jgi:hypothetical protein